jgi:TonB family protein
MPAYERPRVELPASALGSVAGATDAALPHTTSPDDAAPRASTKRVAQYASLGAAVLVLGIAGFAFSSPARTDAEHAPTESRAERPSSAVVRTASMTTPPAMVTASAGAVRHDSALVATASGVDAGPLAPATEPAAVSDARPSTPAVPASLPNLRKLVVPKVAAPNLDSVMQISAKAAHDVDARAISGRESLQPSSYSDAGSVIPPALIGSAPTPRFPDELRAHPIEGEVIVQFRVNEKGRVEPSSMQVLQSQHELFTQAVRNVLTQFRFEPAHAGTPGSKPQAAWVQFRTRFDARR